MNALIPSVPRPADVRAVTMKLPASPALVIHAFWPERTYSSPSRVAVVLVAPESEPAPGSVSPNEPR